MLHHLVARFYIQATGDEKGNEAAAGEHDESYIQVAVLLHRIGDLNDHHCVGRRTFLLSYAIIALSL